GIRDRNVTGVQTCALPIYVHLKSYRQSASAVLFHPASGDGSNSLLLFCSFQHAPRFHPASWKTLPSVFYMPVLLLLDSGFLSECFRSEQSQRLPVLNILL